MPQFPDDRHLPRSEDGKEPILGGSVGLNRILIMLKETAPQPHRIPWGAVVINAYTVFRNIYVKGLLQDDLTARFRMDIDLFRLYLDAYLTTFGNPVLTIPLVVYVPDYSALAKTDLREPSPTTAEMNAHYDIFIKRFPAGESQFSISDATALWTVTAGTQGTLPHIALAQWLQNKALRDNKFGYRHGLPVMMISHCPIDLHIYRRVPHLLLVESYQGTIRPPREFYNKLSTRSEDIPFIMPTHRAFGDPVHLTPLATAKQRKVLLELAKTKHWMQLPSEAVLKDIATVTERSIAELTRIRL